MHVFKVEVAAERVTIEVGFGKERIVHYELPMRGMQDRAAIETAFSSAEGLFRKEVLEWIQSRTQIS